MAKLPDPWKCDVCPAIKQPSNGWFLGYGVGAERVGADGEGEYTAVRLFPWLEVSAEDYGVTHLCGLECATTWFQREVAKLQEMERKA